MLPLVRQAWTRSARSTALTSAHSPGSRSMGFPKVSILCYVGSCSIGVTAGPAYLRQLSLTRRRQVVACLRRKWASHAVDRFGPWLAPGRGTVLGHGETVSDARPTAGDSDSDCVYTERPPRQAYIHVPKSRWSRAIPARSLHTHNPKKQRSSDSA